MTRERTDEEDASRPMSAIGLDAASRALLSRLLDEGEVDVTSEAGRLRLPADVVTGRLEDLRQRGLAVQAAGQPDRYAAVDPRSALTAPADRVADDIRALRAAIPALAARFEATRARESLPTGAESRITNDPSTVAGWYTELQHEARHQVRVFDRPPYISAPAEGFETASIAHGVVHRAVYTLDSFERPGALDEIVRLGEAGEEGRVVQMLPIKLAIADDDAAVVVLTVEKASGDALFTRSRPLIAVLVEVFERYWSIGTPVSRSAVSSPPTAPRGEDLVAPNVGRPGASSRESQALLALIGAGATDDAIAAHLGMSVRSVRRRTRALMDELGAQNRFQFGALAARRHWI